MAYDSSGKWKPEDDSVANKIASITSGSSNYMRQARTAGMQGANRRGLGNSSMAVGAAQGAAIDRALPIAGQDAQQTHAKNLAEQQHLNDFDRDAARYAAAEREMLARAMTDLSNQRSNSYATIAGNPQIPADARNAVYGSINDQHTAALRYLEQLYGVNLAGQAAPPPAPAPAPALPVSPQPVPIGVPIAGVGNGLGGYYAYPENYDPSVARGLNGLGSRYAIA